MLDPVAKLQDREGAVVGDGLVLLGDGLIDSAKVELHLAVSTGAHERVGKGAAPRDQKLGEEPDLRLQMPPQPARVARRREPNVRRERLAALHQRAVHVPLAVAAVFELGRIVDESVARDASNGSDMHGQSARLCPRELARENRSHRGGELRVREIGVPIHIDGKKLAQTDPAVGPSRYPQEDRVGRCLERGVASSQPRTIEQDVHTVVVGGARQNRRRLCRKKSAAQRDCCCESRRNGGGAPSHSSRATDFRGLACDMWSPSPSFAQRPPIRLKGEAHRGHPIPETVIGTTANTGERLNDLPCAGRARHG